jgi:uncharacterized protein (TIGR00725 family)
VDSAEYLDGLELGRLLARRGFNVCSGGYYGVMEAVSRGASEVGTKVVGVTMDQFPGEPNRYLTERIPSKNFYLRLEELIDRSDGFIALRGGLGTVTEIALTINKLHTKVMPEKPIILLGSCWKPFLDSITSHLAIGEDLHHFQLAESPTEAVGMLMEFFNR